LRIYLAALDSIDNPIKQLITEGKIPQVFYSFFGVKNTDKHAEQFKLIRKHAQTIFVDSGAHSFFSHGDQGLAVTNTKPKAKKETDPFVYFNNYITWLKANWDQIDYFAELDIGELLGQAQVIKWRELITAEGMADKMVPVWHPAVTTEDEFRAVIEQAPSRYVAVEGLRKGTHAVPYVRTAKFCYENRCRVHGFAMVRNKFMESVPFFSVDSNSWKAGGMYGITYQWRNGKRELVRAINPAHKSKYDGQLSPKVQLEKGEKARYQSYGAAANAMANAARHYTNIWKARGVDWDAID